MTIDTRVISDLQRLRAKLDDALIVYRQLDRDVSDLLKSCTVEVTNHD